MYDKINIYMAEKKTTKESSKSSETNRDKGSKKRQEQPEKNQTTRLKEETRHMVIGVIFFALTLFFIIAGFNGGGVAGGFIKNLFGYLFGVGYALVPILCAILGITFIKSGRPHIALMQAIGSVFFLVGSLGLIDIATSPNHEAGLLGHVAAYPFIALFDSIVATLFLGTLLIISLLVLLDTRPSLAGIEAIIAKIKGVFFKKKEFGENDDMLVTGESDERPIEELPKSDEVIARVPEPKEPLELEEDIPLQKAPRRKSSSYVAPPINLLETDRGKPNTGDIKANANIIKRTLANFGIIVEMDEVTIGPTVTRYAFKPAEGVKLSRILGLQNDLALALAAHPIRIEAPIPGKSLVGIEIPNKGKSIIGLGSLLADPLFANAEKPLMIALGRSIDGKPNFANLAKMPHVLVAGATGSGKSVTIHSVITSLLYRNGPDDLRFIMVDPKRVELTLYNKIPHLLTPVITDAKKAILALKWATKEMDRRYNILEAESVRDIESYHKNILKNGTKGGSDGTQGPEPMPYIVIIIDELADIMQSYPRELESAIVRLAQMSRAVGIHLLLSTQRPSVNVITGLIKANIPARVALAVSSQIDSRTILDQAGAEKLLGAGDMLYLAGDAPQPSRLQCAFISEPEVKSVVKFITSNNDSDGADEIALSGTISSGNNIFESGFDDDENGGDDLYEDARMTVIESGKASTSFLQRKLGVGYARAARLIDMLEERGVVGPGQGAKPRDVLVKQGDGIMDEPA